MNSRILGQLLASALAIGLTIGSASAGGNHAKGGHAGGSPGPGPGPVVPPVAAPAPASITGTIQTIDLQKKKITIQTGVGTTLLLSVPGSAPVTRNGAATSLKNLALNDTLTAQYNVTKLTATMLSATGPAVSSVSGKISSVSFATGRLTVGKTALQTTSGTRTSRNGQFVSLRQVTLKDSIVAHASAGTNVALDIVASGPAEVELRGVITSITGNSVTVAPDDGSTAVVVTIDPTTHIEVNDMPGTLADLQPTQAVEVEYDPGTLIAFSVSAGSEGEDAEITGVVFGVDPVAGTVTITPTGGGPNITLLVNASTKVDVNDTQSTLAGVEVGMPVKAEYGAATLLATEIEAGATEVESEAESD
jgi:hypothetical protein